MKKSLSIILALTITVSGVLAACSSSKSKDEGLNNGENEFGFEVVDVTDENGETVTDANGEPVTEEIYVQYTTDKNGNVVAVQIGENGEKVTDSKGKDVTIKTDVNPYTTTKKDDSLPETSKAEKPTASTSIKQNSNEATTNDVLTTIKHDKDVVPSTSESGTRVSFSNADQQTIKQMLEVPYLYTANYENTNGVPTSIATHAAIWMADRETMNTSSYASGTIVLDLFKFFGQTVVNFKTNCNGANNENISYNEASDTFKIKAFESKTHTVTLKSIESLGNNNYYKVTANVSGCIKKNVVAIIQKNKLDSSLGFSIKALQWS